MSPLQYSGAFYECFNGVNCDVTLGKQPYWCNGCVLVLLRVYDSLIIVIHEDMICQ